MPLKSKSVCSAPGCLKLAENNKTRCAEHYSEWQEKRARQLEKAHLSYNQRRPETDAFYRTARWRKKSEIYRRDHPLCEECEKLGLVVEARMVDHIEPYRLRPELALEDDNLRALCWQCHNRIGKRVKNKID